MLGSTQVQSRPASARRELIASIIFEFTSCLMSFSTNSAHHSGHDILNRLIRVLGQLQTVFSRLTKERHAHMLPPRACWRCQVDVRTQACMPSKPAGFLMHSLLQSLDCTNHNLLCCSQIACKCGKMMQQCCTWRILMVCMQLVNIYTFDFQSHAHIS